MIYSDFQGKKLSLLGFGTMRLPTGADGSIDEHQVAEMTAYAMEHGVNYFDTAYPYHGGDSERVIGRVLSKYPRDNWYLASKYPGHQVSSSYDPADIFEEQLHTINEAFAETFREMFNGGEAKLRLDAPDNILESGVEIYAAPPGKIIKNLVSLSGGEQALTAIALYFAILKIKPSPFCLLDEIEAALDDVNVARYAAYLHRLAAKTQFVTITHRRGTMEEADKLYGVTMINKGISRVIAIDVDEVSKMNLDKQ